MPRFAANLSTMYAEHPALDRLAAAARDGFEATECLFPYDHPALEWRRRLDELQVRYRAALHASLPERQAEFRAGLDQALEYAAVLRCANVHVMAGLLPSGADADERRRRWAAYESNVAWAAQRARGAGVTILVEPINQRDMPGYLLTRHEDAQALLERVGAPNLKVQLDLYHAQITQGDLTTLIRTGVRSGQVGHVQIAGVPDRHEPDEGELAYGHLFAELDAAGYVGWVGCEYRPRGGTSAGLGWFAAYRRAASRSATASRSAASAGQVQS
jgi:hydroxypyruvate isomerase